MFGPSFADCWYAIPGVPVLQLSGDLTFRSPKCVRKQQYDVKGRPFVLARRPSRRSPDAPLRERREMLHRAVMSVVLGRELAPGEFVCHRDDVKQHNWPCNLSLGDRKSNAADSIRNGRQAKGICHPSAKLSEEQVNQIRGALARGEKGRDLAREFGVHKSLISRIKHGVRRTMHALPHDVAANANEFTGV